MARRFINWLMPLGLVLALLLGWAWPPPGRYLNSTPSQTIAIILLFLISGVELRTDSLHNLIPLWPAIVFGLVSILFITPLFGIVFRFIPMDPFVAVGLSVFALSPTTVSTGCVLTSQCHGNMHIALFLTVATNIIAVFTIPFLAPVIISGAGFSLDPLLVLIELIYTVLVPLLFGKLVLQRMAPVRQWCDVHRTGLKLISIFLLIMIPWMKMSSSVDSFSQISPMQFVLTAVISLAMHSIFVIFNALVSSGVRFPVDVRKSIVVMCSQKTLTVAFAVVASLPDAPESGLYPIPIIIGHLMQMLFDSIMVARWTGDDLLPVDDALKSKAFADDIDLTV